MTKQKNKKTWIWYWDEHFRGFTLRSEQGNYMLAFVKQSSDPSPEEPIEITTAGWTLGSHGIIDFEEGKKAAIIQLRNMGVVRDCDVVVD